MAREATTDTIAWTHVSGNPVRTWIATASGGRDILAVLAWNEPDVAELGGPGGEPMVTDGGWYLTVTGTAPDAEIVDESPPEATDDYRLLDMATGLLLAAINPNGGTE